MTALDRALIKVYSPDRRAPAGARPRAPRVTSIPAAPRPEMRSTAVSTIEPPVTREEADDEIQAMELPPAGRAPTFEPHAAMTAMETLIGAYYEPPSVEELYAPFPSVYRAELETPATPAPKNFVAVPSPRQSAPAAMAPEPLRPETTSAVAPPASLPPASKPLSAFAAASKPEEQESAFRPLLEVDRFAWPEVCDSLDSLLAQSDVDFASLAEQLAARAARGEKVIAFAGCGLGAGCTTTLLCVARRLATRNIKAVVVDADFVNPQLARQLGVSAQAGWEDVLSGELPLGEVLVASPADSLALVPWRQKAAPSAGATANLRAAVTFGILRDHYDLVLIDAGPVDSPERGAALLSYREAAQLAGLYLVYDSRALAVSQVAEISGQIEAAGVMVYGAIENFSAPAARPSLSVYGSEA